MKYSIGTTEGDYERGSDSRVLKNKLGITSETEMQEAEEYLLLQLYNYIFADEFSIKRLSFQDIMVWHRKWLKPIYAWAGELRTVDMSKGDFRFAAAQFLQAQIQPFEDEFLNCYSKLNQIDFEELVSFLAKSHVEFILIHPFREGNGRMSRLLMDVLATQAGYGPLDYSLWDQHKVFYFGSIQAGVAGDYQHMERLVRDILIKAH
ncbi:Fic/DOC family protein [Acinetobacter haemolyticus]|uniref:Fic/DOC family protein n=2 Tax=Acinetobacter haemolyticus TaxID=29430 RepID=UPI0013733F8B|nr:Fic family protein [Acinetobacter haemolyticus]NAS09528.1 cell filamentation protein Fic [Acinetobacter haemolyticus]